MKTDHYPTYNHIHKLIQHSAQEIQLSDFKPDMILAIGGGGYIPARIMRSFIKIPMLSVTVEYYDANNQTYNAPVKRQWLDREHMDLTGKNILLVDEVDDSRVTLAYVLNELLKEKPKEIAVFVLQKKLKPKNAELPAAIKKYFVGEEVSDAWIHYPWEDHDIDEHDRNSQAAATASQV